MAQTAETQDTGTTAEPHDLEDVLAGMARAAEQAGEAVSVGALMHQFGRRSFGPLLLVPALIGLTPLGAIPLLPSAMAVVVILIAGQLLIGLRHFWLPRVLLERTVPRDKLDTAIEKTRPVAAVVDRLLRPRLTWLTRAPFVYPAALVCVLVALTVPPLEVVPFACALSFLSIGLFALALTADDGLLTLLAFAVALGAGWMVLQVV